MRAFTLTQSFTIMERNRALETRRGSVPPTDNVSELTARINDDGRETSFANWLR